MIFKDSEDFRSMDPWRMFRIMAEFVEGFEEMAKLGPSVSIFGSARTKPEDPYYKMGVDMAKMLADNGYNIITGGGPGIMEAANKGALESAKGTSIGLNIDLPFEQKPNPYVEKLLSFRYFFCRKVMFSKYSCAIIVLPDGFGTLDEMFENLTLIQTNKIPVMPIILMGTDCWSGLVDWIKDTMLEKAGAISPEDTSLFHLSDSPEEVTKIIMENCPFPHDTEASHMPKKVFWSENGKNKNEL